MKRSLGEMQQSLRHHSQSARRHLQGFFLDPADPMALSLLRILVAATLLFQAISLAPVLLDLYGSSGLTQESLNQYFRKPYTPQLSWLANQLPGWTESQVIRAVGVTYVGMLCLLLFGFATRLSAVATWFLHWTFMASSLCSTYGVDTLAHIILFYFIWMPIGARLSLDSLLFKKTAENSSAARLAIRILQIHLCIIYLSGGVEKAMGIQWWNGEAIWRSLMLPVYNQYNFSWLAKVPGVAMVLGWLTLVVEIGYAVFIWPTRTRAIWVSLILMLHIGIGVFLGLKVFALFMCALSLCVFGVDPTRPFHAIRGKWSLMRSRTDSVLA